MIELANGWNEIDGKLALHLKCNNFMQAVDRINLIAEIAEELNHHPDIAIRNYNELVISTSTHDKNKVTTKDYQLATEINKKLSSNL